ncbi:type II toxin-antitoxin system YafQ family toxin [Campylobacter mucosalis]|uniref:Putative toxin-antitoxin system, toxin component, YafQ family n=1 Tax=Campylobacter mucosalis CCUG 21559 TaxID=1032067 RepID=A0A6G5QFN4_9BACT|nr:type II toxin-antitoxin system YafQ family toxin [Campylobacter mucosalis]QCD44452.1 putative toxin-antitoxin system, toxin component, YafQ family [Campylobacter mucosalis CCUG 21559]
MKIHFTKNFKKQFKKLSDDDKSLAFEVIEKISNGKVLEKRFKNHALKGKFKGLSECHLKPDLLLVYEIKNEIFTLFCVGIGSHSELF